MSASKAQFQAKISERDRQDAISRGTQQANAIFGSQERQGQYNDFYNATRDLGMQDLNRQKRKADLGAKFSLARGGMTGGSVARDAGVQLGKDYIDGLLTVDRRAQGATSDLMSADQQAKNNMIAMVQSGLDLTTANQNAANSLRTNLQAGEATRLVGGLGDIFGAAADMKRASEDARVRRQAEIQYGNSVYSPWFGYGK